MSSSDAAEMPGPPQRPPAWDTLARALAERRPVRARYHGHERVVCPHALGWSGRRAKVLAYQVAGTTSAGALPTAAGQRWRSMFVDEIEAPVVVEAGWQSAGNYCDDARRMGMDVVEARLPAAPGLAGDSRG